MRSSSTSPGTAGLPATAAGTRARRAHTAAPLAKQTAEGKEMGTTQDTLGRFPMVTAAMEIFFCCWLDLNNIWLLGYRALLARSA